MQLYKNFCDELEKEIIEAFSFAKNDSPPDQDSVYTQIFSDL